MTTWTSKDFEQMEKRYRTKFINTLSGAKSANLVGTQDKAGKTNLSMVSSVVHLGANPSLMGMVIRPRSVPRHTFDNLVETGVYTINHVNSEITKQAHQSSARYPKETSEFDAVGLTPGYEQDFQAPYVKESQVRLGLKLVEVLPLRVNDTEFVVGEIVWVSFDEKFLHEDGTLDVGAAGAVAVAGLDFYQTLKPLYRLSYAKPDREVEEI